MPRRIEARPEAVVVAVLGTAGRPVTVRLRPEGLDVALKAVEGAADATLTAVVEQGVGRVVVGLGPGVVPIRSNWVVPMKMGSVPMPT